MTYLHVKCSIIKFFSYDIPSCSAASLLVTDSLMRRSGSSLKNCFNKHAVDTTSPRLSKSAVPRLSKELRSISIAFELPLSLNSPSWRNPNKEMTSLFAKIFYYLSI